MGGRPCVLSHPSSPSTLRECLEANSVLLSSFRLMARTCVVLVLRVCSVAGTTGCRTGPRRISMLQREWPSSRYVAFCVLPLALVLSLL